MRHCDSVSNQSENDNLSIGSNGSTNFNQQIRSRINSFKISMFNGPKFSKPGDSNNSNSSGNSSGGNKVPESPQMDSKSWFQRWNFKQDNGHSNSVSSSASNTSQSNDQEKEKEFTFIINDRPLNSVKADLIHAFLSTQDLIHNINSPMLFRCEYRSPDKFLARNVRFKVEIIIDNNSNASNTNGQVLTNNININNQLNKSETSTNPTFRILFTLINGKSTLMVIFLVLEKKFCT
jgi:hypothetical protein